MSDFINLNDATLEEYDQHFQYYMQTEDIVVFGDIYEFGVFGGKSLRCTIQQLRENHIKYNKIYGFDSFEGLPEEDGDFIKTIAPGAFNAQKLYNVSKEEVIQKVHDYTYNIPILISGWFSDVLNGELVKQYNMQPASYINVDCDLYISARTVLDWIFRNNLWQHGTVLRYDDWFPNMGENFDKAQMFYREKEGRISIWGDDDLEIGRAHV
jgi:hypothetical protein